MTQANKINLDDYFHQIDANIDMIFRTKKEKLDYLSELRTELIEYQETCVYGRADWVGWQGLIDYVD